MSNAKILKIYVWVYKITGDKIDRE